MARKQNSSITPRAQEMLAAIERYQSSGLTQKAFCETEGIPWRTLQHWLPLYRSNTHRMVAKHGGARRGVVYRL